MDSKIILVLILLFFGKCSYGQNEHNFSLNSDDERFSKCNLFVLGEAHWNQSETAIHQLKLFDILVKKGNRNITLFFETSPSLMYFITKFYYSNDTIWPHEINRIKYNYEEFIIGLRKYRNTVNLKFIPIDLEFGINIKQIRLFKNELLGQITDSLYFADLKRLRSANSRRAIVKEVKKISKDKNLFDKYKRSINKEFWDLFSIEMEILSKRGIVSGLGFSEKKMALRDIEMAKIIDNYYDDMVKHILTIGAVHITPVDDKKAATLFLNMQKFNRRNTVIIGIVYAYDKLLYNGKLYSTEIEYNTLINNGVFDIILLPPK